MKKMFKIVSIFIIGMYLVGCESNQSNERKEQLIELAKQDTKTYFSELTTNLKQSDYSINLLEHELFVDQETNQTIYKGDRIAFLAKDYPSKSGVRELIAEYDGNQLIGLKITVDQNEGTLQPVDNIELSQQFINKHQLATNPEHLKTETDKELSILTFKTTNEEIIKIYVNNEINTVVGFMLYDDPNYSNE